MESGYPGITTEWQADEMIPGLKRAPKVSKVSPIRNLVTRIHSSKRGMEVVRPTNDADGKRMFQKANACL